MDTNLPLSGIKIADFSRVLAGPYATMMLADFGADVLKVESPEGDGTRQWLPPVNGIGQSTYFAGVNRNKRSIVLDLSDAQDRQRAFEIVREADVVIQNFKPGTMAKFGLDYDAVNTVNPRVVYCSISGFGEGKGANLAGYDLLIQAVGGLMSITGEPDGEPVKVGVALVDILTGMNAINGILMALRARDTAGHPQFGKGQHIRLNLMTSLLSALTNQASSTIETGVAPKRMGNDHPSIAPYATFKSADQKIALAVGTDAQFARLAELVGVPELAADEKFATNPARVANRKELKRILNNRLQEKSAAEWVKIFDDAMIPAGRVNDINQALELSESLGLGTVVEIPGVSVDGVRANVRTIANPIDMSDTPAEYRLAPPHIGEHQHESWTA